MGPLRPDRRQTHVERLDEASLSDELLAPLDVLVLVDPRVLAGRSDRGRVELVRVVVGEQGLEQRPVLVVGRSHKVTRKLVERGGRSGVGEGGGHAERGVEVTGLDVSGLRWGGRDDCGWREKKSERKSGERDAQEGRIGVSSVARGIAIGGDEAGSVTCMWETGWDGRQPVTRRSRQAYMMAVHRIHTRHTIERGRISG